MPVRTLQKKEAKSQDAVPKIKGRKRGFQDYGHGTKNESAHADFKQKAPPCPAFGKKQQRQLIETAQEPLTQQEWYRYENNKKRKKKIHLKRHQI